MLAGLVALGMMGCHPYGGAAEKPIAVGVPERVSTKLDNAQAELINSVGALINDYDAAACEQEGQMAQRSDMRQAMAEAYLQVNDALGTARQRVETPRGGGPPPQQRRTLIFVEEAQSQPAQSPWSCVGAADSPSCTQAAASDVARRVFQNYIDGYDLNPVTAGDAMEAFAADISWASRHLLGAESRADAFRTLQEQCQAGDSPLLRFFQAADAYDDPGVRSDVSQVRRALVGTQPGVCEALPVFYDNLMTEITNTLERRTRRNECTVPTWQVLWSG